MEEQGADVEELDGEGLPLLYLDNHSLHHKNRISVISVDIL